MAVDIREPQEPGLLTIVTNITYLEIKRIDLFYRIIVSI